MVLNNATYRPADIYSIPLLIAAGCAFAILAFHTQESTLSSASARLSTFKHAYLDRLHGLFSLHKLHVDLAPQPR